MHGQRLRPGARACARLGTLHRFGAAIEPNVLRNPLFDTGKVSGNVTPTGRSQRDVSRQLLCYPGTEWTANRVMVGGGRAQSGAWDDNGVLIYTTLNHIKYCLPNGDSGIIRTLDVPVYITQVVGDVIFCLDRDGRNRQIQVRLHLEGLTRSERRVGCSELGMCCQHCQNVPSQGRMTAPGARGQTHMDVMKRRWT